MLAPILFLTATEPAFIRLPAGGLVPSVSVTARHTLIAYGCEGHAIVSELKGGKLLGPARLDTGGSVVAGGERGPRIAQSASAAHVVWQGNYKDGPAVWYSRSDDGGITFTEQKNLLEGKTPGIDMPTVAASKNDVVILWLDGREGEDSDNPVTSSIYFCESKDGGKTFGPNTRAQYEFKGRACACCTLHAKFNEAGKLEVLFRTGYKDVRDIWMLRRISGARFAGSLIHSDNWMFHGCPMDGPRGDSKCVAWMSGGNVFWRTMDTTGAARIAMADDNRGKYPGIATLGDKVLGIWQQGANLRWSFLPNGRQGSFPSSGNRSAVFVGSDGKFYIVN